MSTKYFFLVVFFFQFIFARNLFSEEPFAFLAPYDFLLHKYVHKGEIDSVPLNLVSYKHWQKDPLHQEAMRFLQSSTPEKLSAKEKLVFWINAYNLLTIDLIISKKEKESIRNLGKWFRLPWGIYQWKIGERAYTLDDIENEILRKLGEPRIHMAIVCASISCPDLRPEVFSIKDLEDQLVDQTIQFLNNPEKGFKEELEHVKVSMIFKWFLEDFGEEKDLFAFLKRYHSITNTHIQKLSYFQYNWGLNGHW